MSPVAKQALAYLSAEVYLFISVYFTLKSVDAVHMSTALCKKGVKRPLMDTKLIL